MGVMQCVMRIPLVVTADVLVSKDLNSTKSLLTSTSAVVKLTSWTTGLNRQLITDLTLLSKMSVRVPGKIKV